MLWTIINYYNIGITYMYIIVIKYGVFLINGILYIIQYILYSKQ